MVNILEKLQTKTGLEDSNGKTKLITIKGQNVQDVIGVN